MTMWYWIAVQVVAAIVVSALTPKPKAPERQKPRLPVAEDGRPITVIFGDVWVDDANILAFKDEGVIPIKKGGKK